MNLKYYHYLIRISQCYCAQRTSTDVTSNPSHNPGSQWRIEEEEEEQSHKLRGMRGSHKHKVLSRDFSFLALEYERGWSVLSLSYHLIMAKGAEILKQISAWADRETSCNISMSPIYLLANSAIVSTGQVRSCELNDIRQWAEWTDTEREFQTEGQATEQARSQITVLLRSAHNTRTAKKNSFKAILECLIMDPGEQLHKGSPLHTVLPCGSTERNKVKGTWCIPLHRAEAATTSATWGGTLSLCR